MALRDRGLSYEAIAEALGTSRGAVSSMISVARRNSKYSGRFPIEITAKQFDELSQAAVARGMTVAALVSLLMDGIIESDLFSAVLDD